ncbi:MAG: oligoendopeptidase F [Clostridia bacterium]|nr:oligoendopeptidase F [Clostridia bacterium]
MTDDRKQIPEKYKWDLSKIYGSMDAFEADIEAVKDAISRADEHRANMLASANGLLSLMDEMTGVNRIMSKLFSYTSHGSDLDTSDNSFLALVGRVRNLSNDFGEAYYFTDPMLISLDDETLNGWYESCPALRAYERTIYKTRRYAPHSLGDDGERLMAQLSGGMGSHSSIRSILSNAEMKFGNIKGEDGKPIKLTEANFVALEGSFDRRLRRSAFNRMYSRYGEFGNTYAALMNAYVKEHCATSKARGYESSLQASVFRDEVTPEIYNNLCDTVGANLDVLYDYYELKREMLGVPKFHLYDVYTPLIASCEKKYTFEEAVEEVLDTVSIFGDEYHDVLENGLKNDRWVDVYPSRGKRNGAYSSGSYDVAPYMLLNFTDTLDDVSTLAHEAGHSMHTYFSAKNNTPQDSRYTIFVAEVASTVNELLFAHRKLRESDSDDEKLSILNQTLDTYKGTLFRQTMFAEFERFMHVSCEEGKTLTRDFLCENYYNLVKRYFGPKVVCDEGIANEWMRIPHFYMWFYVYKYATCISAASSIVKRIESEGEPYIKKYLEFLSCGGSKSPLDSLAVAGIDMTKPDVIEDAVADFKDTLAMFKKLQGKS